MDFTGKSSEAIQMYIDELNAEKASVKQALREAVYAKERVEGDEKWSKKVNEMTDAEKDSMKKALEAKPETQVVGADGIVSAENVSDV